MARIREALRLPAPPPHGLSSAAGLQRGGEPAGASPSVGGSAAGPAAAGGTGLPILSVLPEEVARPWLPDGGETPAERRRLLRENLGRLRAEVLEAADMAAAGTALAGLAREKRWQRLAWHPHPLVEPLLAGLSCDTCRIDAASFDKNALEVCDAGITTCEALVAQTGSILVSSGSCGGRALSILPHAHVVVATHDQIMATLADALHAVKDRHAGRLPSMLSFITGPSRTGDIERILVLGAHGPKELILILVG